MFQLDYKKTFRELIPAFLRKEKLMDYLDSIAKPLKDAHTDYLDFRDGINFFATINSQVVHLEHYLNLTYSLNYDLTTRDTDITNGAIIWIETTANLTRRVLYNKVELQDTIVLYNKWNSSTSYAGNEFATEGGRVYQALVSNSGNQPSSTPVVWQDVGAVPVLWNKADYNNDTDFIVRVPVAVGFDHVVMRAQVDQYKIAGKRYQIKTY